MTRAAEFSRLGHVFRHGPLRARRAYWLDAGVLHWRIGNETGHTPISEIASLHFRDFDHPARLRCSIVEKTGRRHVISDVYWRRWAREDPDWFAHKGLRERHVATFRSLTYTLARRLKRANPDAALLVGPGKTEWLASCLVGIAGLGVILAVFWLMVSAGRFELTPAFLAGAMAFTLPQLWPVIRAGGPRPFDPETLHGADSDMEAVES